ncbi:MAG: amidohydrolase [Gammaproteobacteria bacterium]|nr:MAG: amidohydrolase [Gammaproteobacteria bacterium]
MSRYFLALAPILMLAACSPPGGDSDARVAPNKDPFPSTYRALPSETLLIKGATIYTGDGGKIENGDLLIRDGKIAEFGQGLALPAGASEIDASGKWLTPGIIDTHSHLGVYASPSVKPQSDGNEATAPVTAEVWAEHSVNPKDPGFAKALAGGVTSMQILPGSANLIGGRSVTLKNVPSRTMQGMKFPGAPYGLKMACGENPKRVYGEGLHVAPSTAMGNVAGYRAAWIEAEEYNRLWQEYLDGESEEKPGRDLGLETLAGVLNGEILVHNHCYRADEMAVMLDIAKEFGYKITSFHHAIEAYKIADLLAESGTCASMWADWWGFKIEAYDGVRENIALVDKAGACAIVHSDSSTGIQRLNQEAAKVIAAANRGGIPVTEEHAMRWLTENPARALGIIDQTGTLAVGKDADLVIWDGNPFSVYSRAENVFIDGALVYDRNDPARQPKSDFMLGILEIDGEIK